MKLKLIFWNRPLLLSCFLAVLMLSSSVEANKPLLSNSPKKTVKVLMVGGGASHDFDKWYRGADVQTLEKDGMTEVRYTDRTDSLQYYLPQADVLFLSNNQPIADPETRKAIMDFADAGNGLVLAHAALWYNWEDWPEYNQQLVSGGSRGHDKYGAFDVELTGKKHPVTKGVPQKFSLKDELYYYKVDSAGPGIDILAMASTEGSEGFPSVFVIQHPKSRIVGIALGHDAESHDLEAYHTLLRNAVKWAAK